MRQTVGVWTILSVTSNGKRKPNWRRFSFIFRLIARCKIVLVLFVLHLAYHHTWIKLDYLISDFSRHKSIFPGLLICLIKKGRISWMDCKIYLTKEEGNIIRRYLYVCNLDFASGERLLSNIWHHEIPDGCYQSIDKFWSDIVANDEQLICATPLTATVHIQCRCRWLL